MHPPVLLAAALAAMPAPTAIIDSVVGHDALRPFQLLTPGTEIVIPPGGRVRLAYFASCVHETARDGRLRIGVTASLTADADVERVTADCAPPRYGPARARVPGALVLRRSVPASAVAAPVMRVRTRSPLLVAARYDQLVLTRTQPGGRSVFVPVVHGVADLARLGIELEPDSTYTVCGERDCARIWIDTERHHAAGPILERLVRVP